MPTLRHGPAVRRCASVLIAATVAAALPATASAHDEAGAAALQVVGTPIIRQAPAFIVPAPLQGITISEPRDGAFLPGGRSLSVSGTARILTGRVSPGAAQVQVRTADGIGTFATITAPFQCTGNCDGGTTGPRSFAIGPVTIPASVLPPTNLAAERTLTLRLTVGNNPSLNKNTTFAESIKVTFAAAFQDANLFAAGLQVTQAIQDRVIPGTALRRASPPGAVDYPGTIPFVAGKPTAVRLLPRLPVSGGFAERTLSNVTGLLHAFRNGQELPDSPIEPIHVATAAPLGTTSDQVALRQSLDTPGAVIEWRIPDAWATGTLDLRATVNDPGMQAVRRLQECDGCVDGANSLAARVRFQPSISQLRFDPFVVEYDPPGSDPPVSPPANFEAELDYLERIYPVADGIVDVGSSAGLIRTSNNDCSALVRDVFFASLASSRSGLAVGLMPNHPDMCVVPNGDGAADDFRADGIGAAGFSALWKTGAGSGLTAPHEVGHLLGRPHASCDHGEDADGAGGCDASFVPAHAQLGGNGFNVKNMNAYPETIDDGAIHLHDVMSYGPFRWISTTTYRALFDELNRRKNGSGVVSRGVPDGRTGLALRTQGEIASRALTSRLAATPRDSLVVTATVGPGATAEIGRAARLDASPLPLGRTGPVVLRALDAAGRTVAEHRFDLDPVAVHGPPVTVTGATFPNPGRIRTLSLEAGGKVLARRDASGAAPTVKWTDPAKPRPLAARGLRRVSWTAGDRDGDKLSYVVQFSRDGGRTWRTLDPQVPGLSYMVDLARLPSTRNGRFRVIATDGLRSSTDVADRPVRVPNHPPTAAITAPVTGAAVSAGASMPLAGAAGDIDAGTLAPASLAWRSSRDGDLGTGRSLSARLSPGRHDLVLTATDAQGGRGTAKTTVVVAPAPGAVDRTAPKLVRARRAGSSAIVLTFSEDVVGLGSASVVVPGAGRITGIVYEPRSRRATIRFERRVPATRLTLRAPLADPAGNPLRRTAAKL
jgi:hypothetical protein